MSAGSPAPEAGSHSTATSPQGLLTCGVDVSDRYSHYCLIDSVGRVVETGRLATTEAAVQDQFTRFPACRVVLEVGTHSPWLSRLISSLGHQCIVANAYRVRLIAQSVRKNDRSDAETLARLGRIDPDLLSPVHHRTEDLQADLAVLRARDGLIGARAKLINQVRGTTKTVGVRLPIVDANAFHLKVLALIPPPLMPALAPLLTCIAGLTQQIRAMDREIVRLCRDRYPDAGVLQQVPGVGHLIALTYVLTIADPARFEHSRDVGPFLGLVPRQRDSGERSPQLGITKVGDAMLRRLLVQGAHYILGPHGPDSDLRRWGMAQVSRGGVRGKKRAIIAVARKLAVLLHRLWVTGEVYIPLRTFAA
jgi:transposase